MAASQPIYSIGAVAHMLGVPTATLRAWEERYGVVRPMRSEGAQRLYTREQIEQLRYLKGRIDGGLSAADAHRLLADELSGGYFVAESDPPDPDPRPRVLIAERDAYAADLAEYFLKTEGYQVWVALDAEGARAAFGECAPDVVLIDLLISGGAGLGLCREFCERPSTHVLAVSALDSADEALDAGARAFIPKPLEPLRLVSVVRDLLGTSALGRAARRGPVGK